MQLRGKGQEPAERVTDKWLPHRVRLAIMESARSPNFWTVFFFVRRRPREDRRRRLTSRIGFVETTETWDVEFGIC
jgi:hypothetical protein